VTRTIDQLLDQARARLRRLNPHQAAALVKDGGLLIDIRPAAQRQEEGQIPGPSSSNATCWSGAWTRPAPTGLRKCAAMTSRW
jgi:hypothetical protein